MTTQWYTPKYWHARLFSACNWSLSIEKNEPLGINVRRIGRIDFIPIGDVSQIAIKESTFSWALRIHEGKSTWALTGLSAKTASTVLEELKRLAFEYWSGHIHNVESQLDALRNRASAAFKSGHYIPRSMVSMLVEEVNELLPPVLRESILNELPTSKAKDIAVKLVAFVAASEKLRNESNTRTLWVERKAHKEFFDGIEKNPLTDEQRVAAITTDDYTLVIAAAGSGKTALIVAKIAYLLRTGQYKPNEILVLAFNNDAQKELASRIKARIPLANANEVIPTYTFHSFASSALGMAKGKKPTISKIAADGDDALSEFIAEAISSASDADKQFRKNWIRLSSIYQDEILTECDFERSEDYMDYELRDSDFQSHQPKYQTIKGEMVRSRQELAICNLLCLEGINYLYEMPYEHDTATPERTQYRPDFYYPDIKAYHEHFALNRYGQPPKWFGQEYLEGVAWKRDIHRQKGTQLIETTSGMFSDESWADYLLAELNARNIPRAALDEDTQKRIAVSLIDENKKLVSLLARCISIVKSAEWGREQMEVTMGSLKGKRPELFYKVFWPLYEAYEQELTSTNTVDFDDLINGASQAITQGQYAISAKIVLVDEFQDISRGRANLLKAILRSNPGTRLFAVGDDAQSIYRFTGADLSIMTDYNNHFGPCELLLLSKTFRFTEEIAKLTNKFITKNPSQINKIVVAEPNKLAQSVRKIASHSATQEEQKVRQALDEICTLELDASKRPSVLFLGRYKQSRPKYFDKLKTKFSELDITFKTVHSSKGLEADYVFVVGMNKGRMPFPSFPNDPIIDALLPAKDAYPHAEERRLFYVAMTRTRKVLYVCCRRGCESDFLNELGI